MEVIVYYAGDGALVVQIDTKEIDMISWRGRLRVNLNRRPDLRWRPGHRYALPAFVFARAGRGQSRGAA